MLVVAPLACWRGRERERGTGRRTSGVQGVVFGVGEGGGLLVEVVEVGFEVDVGGRVAGGGVQGGEVGLVDEEDVGEVLEGGEGEGWWWGRGWVAGFKVSVVEAGVCAMRWTYLAGTGSPT